MFASTIFGDSKTNIPVNSLFGALSVVSTIIPMVLTDSKLYIIKVVEYGRKPLLIIGAVGIASMHVLSTSSFLFYGWEVKNSEFFRILIIIFSAIALVFYGLSTCSLR